MQCGLGACAAVWDPYRKTGTFPQLQVGLLVSEGAAFIGVDVRDIRAVI